MNKKLKVALIAIVVTAAAVFGTYGVSRIQLELLGRVSLYGTIEENPWDEDIVFSSDDYYTLTVERGDTLKILMLTDTHFKNGGWYANYVWVGEAVNQGVYADIKTLVKETSPDFIYLTGDIETASLNDKIFEQFCAFMEKLGVDWTMTMGNHDGENRADKAYISGILSDAKYSRCVYDVGYTNLNGLGNTVIPVVDETDTLLYAFILMDFGDWQKRKDPVKQYSTYEAGETEEQRLWYAWVVEGLAAEKGETVETMLLAHIPFHAVTYAAKLSYMDIKLDSTDGYLYGTDPFDTESEFGYTNAEYLAFREAYHANGDKGYNILTLASYYEYKENDLFFKLITDLGSTKQIVTGHNHCDGYSVRFDGIVYTSVVKTGDIYVDKAWDNGNRGGTLFLFENVGGSLSVVSERLYV
ncbi:MAG: metallophosphoesterase [Clostridiales bacterium]|jgi:hypothetical protein|nr:metallophosphoesterase [Clostridiales bacterium]